MYQAAIHKGIAAVFMVGRVGHEPTRDKPARLQCAAIAAGRMTRVNLYSNGSINQ